MLIKKYKRMNDLYGCQRVYVLGVEIQARRLEWESRWVELEVLENARVESPP